MTPPDTLTDAQVAELERLLGEATPGKWYWDSYSTIAVGCEPGGPFDASKDDAEEAPLGRQIVATVENVPGTHGDQLHHPQLRANARLIVAAINALPALLAERRALREESEQLRVQLAGCSVAALGWAHGKNDAKPGDYGHSVAFDDVKALRQRAEQAEAERDRLRAALWVAVKHWRDPWTRCHAVPEQCPATRELLALAPPLCVGDRVRVEGVVSMIDQTRQPPYRVRVLIHTTTDEWGPWPVWVRPDELTRL